MYVAFDRYRCFEHYPEFWAKSVGAGKSRPSDPEAQLATHGTFEDVPCEIALALEERRHLRLHFRFDGDRYHFGMFTAEYQSREADIPVVLFTIPHVTIIGDLRGRDVSSVDAAYEALKKQHWIKGRAGLLKRIPTNVMESALELYHEVFSLEVEPPQSPEVET